MCVCAYSKDYTLPFKMSSEADSLNIIFVLICLKSTLATVVRQTISQALKTTAAPECTPSIFCQSCAIALCVDKLFSVTFKQSDKAVGWGSEQCHRAAADRDSVFHARTPDREGQELGLSCFCVKLKCCT